MSFWAPVLHFLRQTRILGRVTAFIERYDLPDLSFLVLFSAFPLFQIFEHSTLWLLPFCVFLLLWSGRALLWRREVELDFADFLVLLILLLQLSTALTGYGRVADALVVVLLTSVWFSARRFFLERGADALVFFSSLVLVAVSAIGVGEYLFGMAELRWIDAVRFGNIGGRVTSLFSNPNILAVYLLLYFPLSLWATFAPQNKGRLRLFFATTSVFCALCILLTWSRGAWLGFLLECLLFLLFLQPQKPHCRPLVAAACHSGSPHPAREHSGKTFQHRRPWRELHSLSLANMAGDSSHAGTPPRRHWCRGVGVAYHLSALCCQWYRACHART